MNMQAMMQQAQKLQKEMNNVKSEVESKEFVGKSSFVTATVNGKKEIVSLKIDKTEGVESDDLELLEDMIVVAINSALKEATNEMESKMARINPGLNGMF